MSEEKDFKNVEEEAVPCPASSSKKKISPYTICVFVSITLICCLISSMLTYALVIQNYKDNPTASAAGNEFMQKVLTKLGAMDSSVREDYIYDIDDDKLLDGVLAGYMYALGDKYAAYYTKEDMASFMSDTQGEMEGIGVSVIYDYDNSAIQIITVFPDSPAEKSGLLPGDRIAFVKVGDNEEYTSIAELGYESALENLRGKAGTEAKFIAYREGDFNNPIEYSVKRQKVTEITVEGRIYTEDKSVGIIRITSFDLKTPEQFDKALKELQEKGAEKLILDVRNNLGGELTSVCNILDTLLPEGTVIRTVDKDGNESVVYKSDAKEVDMPMAVIANGNTASAAELFTSALMDYHKATFVGTTTYGKGSMQTIRTFNDGSGMKYTYRLYCPPTSDNYDGKGIKPDVEVELDDSIKNKNIFTLTDAEDNQLGAAYKTFIK